MMRRLASRQARARLALWVGAAAGPVVIATLLVASVTVQNGLPGSKGARLNVEFAEVGGLNRYDEVRIAGRRVGGVAAVTHREGRAVVELRLEDGLEELSTAAKARIRLAGLIGARYVELVPGKGGTPLSDGATIPMARTSTNPDVFAGLQAFEGRGTQHLQSMTFALGAGLAGRGEDSNRALALTPDLVANAQRLVDALESDRAALRRLFPAGASLAEALEPTREAAARGFADGERALRPLAENPDAARALLRQAARAAEEAPVEMPKGDRLMLETERLSATLTRFTDDAPAALTEAAALLRASPSALRASTPALARARAAVPPVLRLLRALDPLIEPFQHSLERALPQIRGLARRVCDLDQTVPWMRTVVAFGTAAGHELGADNLIRVLSGGDGTFGEALGPDYDSAKPSRHDEDPPPCEGATQVLE